MGDAATKKPPQTMEEPPSELCGVWAYIKWENDGCPNRSAQESDSEYQASIRVSFQSLGFVASGNVLHIWSAFADSLRFAICWRFLALIGSAQCLAVASRKRSINSRDELGQAVIDSGCNVRMRHLICRSCAAT